MICEDLKGMRVLVTGASSGIGSAAAVLFSRQDCYIGVHYFRTPGGAEKIPLGRNGTVEDVAKAILFLASDAASFITGEYIAVNGGLYMRA